MSGAKRQWRSAENDWDLRLINVATRRATDDLSVACLVECGANPNVGVGSAPLLIDVVRAGDVEMAIELLCAGADPNLQADDRNTPLMAAHERPEFAVAMTDALIDHGAEVNFQKESGWTALHCAILAGVAPLCDRLIARGADLDIKTDNGKSAEALCELFANAGVRDVIKQALDERRLEEHDPAQHSSTQATRTGLSL